MGILEGVLGFLAALPKLIEIYQGIVKAVGQARVNAALADWAEAQKLGDEAKKPGLSIEERRELRRRALEKGHSVLGRIVGQQCL